MLMVQVVSIGTIADSTMRHRLMSTRLFRQCEHGCTGWLTYSQIGRTLPLDETERLSDRVRTPF